MQHKNHWFYAEATGLYYRALMEGFFTVPDPDMELREHLKKRVEAEGGEKMYEELVRRDAETAARIHPNDIRRAMRALEIMIQTGMTVTELRTSQQKKRWKDDVIYLGIQREKKILDARIENRTEKMYTYGLINETKTSAGNELHQKPYGFAGVRLQRML